MTPIITVVVPVYNVSDYVPKCLDSLVSQTADNIEIIVVDDGSTDDSGKICDTYAKSHDNVKVIHVENGGLSKARNIGINAAHGEFIGFVDGDDWVEPEFYQNLLNLIVANNSDLSSCGVKYDYDNGEQQLYKEDIVNVSDQEQIYKLLINDKNIYGYACNKLFKTEVVKQILFDEELYSSEDIDFCSKYAMKCESMAYNHSELYHYRQRIGSMTGEFAYSWRKLSVIEAYQRLINVYEEYCPSCKFQIERFLLKQNLNVIGRIKISHVNDRDLLNQLYANVKLLWPKVIHSPQNSTTEKINILLTRLMPAMMLRTKQYLIKKKYK